MRVQLRKQSRRIVRLRRLQLRKHIRAARENGDKDVFEIQRAMRADADLRGFSFTASKFAPATANSDAARFGVWGVIATKATQFGPLFTRLLLCYFKAQEIKSTYTAQAYTELDTKQLAVTYSEYGAALREFAATLSPIAATSPASSRASTCRRRSRRSSRRRLRERRSKADYVSRIETLNTLWLEVLRECFCSALLPPCAGPQASNCIPLAVVTVDVDKCQVIEICNWSARKFALTLPSIFYWTSFINWGAIKEAIARLCCGAADQTIWETLFAMLERTAAANAGAAPAAMEMRTATAPGATASTTPPASGTPLDTYSALVEFMEQATHPEGMARLLSTAQPAAQTATDVASLARRWMPSRRRRTSRPHKSKSSQNGNAGALPWRYRTSDRILRGPVPRR